MPCACVGHAGAERRIRRRGARACRRRARRRGTPRSRAGRRASRSGRRPSTISGKGTPKTKIATKAAAATATLARLRSARPPMRSTAWTTIASTAALRPKNTPSSSGASPSVDVDDAERQDREEARQHEQHPGDHPAARAVQQPAEVDRELLRLRPRQQHAEVERVQEPRLADPALLVDEDAVHHRDLPGRAAEGQRRDPQPDPHRLGEGDAVRAVPAAAPSRRPPRSRARSGCSASCGSRRSASRHQR